MAIKGIYHDKLNKQWIVSEQWAVFLGFSAVAAVLTVAYGVIGSF